MTSGCLMILEEKSHYKTPMLNDILLSLETVHSNVCACVCEDSWWRERDAHLLTPLKMPKLHHPTHTHTFPHLQMHSIARCCATNTYRASWQQEVCCCQKSLGVFGNLSLAQRHADDGCHVSLRSKDVDGNPQRVPCKPHSPSPNQCQQQQQQKQEKEKESSP